MMRSGAALDGDDISGGYAAGYYSYIWAEVLDKDAFDEFRRNGIFDQATARSFRENILQRGGTDDPMTLYKLFKGRVPDVKPLMTSREFKAMDRRPGLSLERLGLGPGA